MTHAELIAALDELIASQQTTIQALKEANQALTGKESDTVKDGGQASPLPYTVGPNDDLYPAEGGMSLRDYFAGQALAGLTARPDLRGIDMSEVSEASFELADEMIKARGGQS